MKGDMKTDRCTSAANVIRILWGKMSVFAWFPKGKWQLTDEKNGLVPHSIYTNRDVTISSHATNDTICSVLRRVRAQRGCPRRKALRGLPHLVTHTHEKEWRGSRYRIYYPYDDTLAMAFLAYSNLPTILLTDLKI